MNIQSIGAAYGQSYEAKRPEQKSVPTQKGIKTEKVEISSQSSELQKVAAIINELPDVRLKVVEEIRARIKNNDYPIENNLNEVVKKLIQNNALQPY
jgi:flagellar biosynthesis anti-sigma factor FlgM